MKKYEAGELLEGTLQHQRDVKKMLEIATEALRMRAGRHDMDKLDPSRREINPEFLEAINGGFQNGWWKNHKIHGHHNPRNLWDLVEMVIDGICACHRRNENGLEKYRPIDVSKINIEEIVKNTEAQIMDGIQLLDRIGQYTSMGEETRRKLFEENRDKYCCK